MTGFEISKGAVTAVKTTRGDIKAGKVGLAAAGHSSVLAEMAGFTLPIRSLALQAFVSEGAAAFPVDACAQSLLGERFVFLLRMAGENDFRLIVDQAYRDYAWSMLCDAAESLDPFS